MKALQGVVTKDGGTREGLIAQYYLGTLKAQTGDAKGAEADLKTAAASGSETAALAKIALAQLYAGQNKISEAQSYLREIVSKPTDLVEGPSADPSGTIDPTLQSGRIQETHPIVESARSEPGGHASCRSGSIFFTEVGQTTHAGSAPIRTGQPSRPQVS